MKRYLVVARLVSVILLGIVFQRSFLPTLNLRYCDLQTLSFESPDDGCARAADCAIHKSHVYGPLDGFCSDLLSDAGGAIQE